MKSVFAGAGIVERMKAAHGCRRSWTDAKGRNAGRARFLKDGDERRIADLGG